MRLNLVLVLLFSLISMPFCFAAATPKSFLSNSFLNRFKGGEAKLKDNQHSIVAAAPETQQKAQLPQGLKLLIGAGGIYAAFLYYGTLQEDVFHYKGEDGSKFTQAWFLQALGEFQLFVL